MQQSCKKLNDNGMILNLYYVMIVLAMTSSMDGKLWACRCSLTVIYS